MKKLITSITILIVSITVGWAQNGSVGMSWSAAPAPAAHSVFVSPHSSKQYLDSVSAAWKKDSIVLEFSKLKYDASGKLVKVKGSVVANLKGSHTSGTFSSNNLKGIDIRVGRPGIEIKGE